MIDGFERRHGPVEDRSIFDGEIIVPPHLRNIAFNSRFNGSLFGSLSRSRTFLNLSANARHTFHGSVPDLSRNQFTFINQTNLNDDNRRMSSTSVGTKITMNSSTTLTLSDISTNSIADTSSITDLNETSINSRTNSSMDQSTTDEFTFQDKMNSVRSLNDIQLKQPFDERYCKSLERPIRALKPIVYTTKPSDFKNSRSASIDTSDSSGYMTLIHTNVRSINRQPPRAISPLCNATSLHDINLVEAIPMTQTTSTFQRKNPTQFDRSGFPRELSLNTITKFKLPRVQLTHPASNQRQ